MLVVLDANEYIFGLGLPRKQSSEKLLEALIDAVGRVHVRACETIVDEVRANLPGEVFKEFHGYLKVVADISEDYEIPFAVAAAYELGGLKEADALIAAYVEWVGADYLITENRHFLSRRDDLPFEVVTAEEFLTIMRR